MPPTMAPPTEPDAPRGTVVRTVRHEGDGAALGGGRILAPKVPFHYVFCSDDFSRSGKMGVPEKLRSGMRHSSLRGRSMGQASKCYPEICTSIVSLLASHISWNPKAMGKGVQHFWQTGCPSW